MSKKYKLLFISASAVTGGGPSHIFNLAELLNDKYHIFYAMPYNQLLEKDLNFKKYLFIKERKISINDIYRIINFSNKHSIDLIHAHGKGAVIIARIVKLFIRKPLIYTPHGIHIKFLNKYIKYLYLVYERIFGLLDNYKIFVSKSELIYAKSLNLIKNNNYMIINNSVKNKPLKKNNYDQLLINKKIGITNSRKNIISISRLVDQKNIFEIIEIARNLNSYNFLILGDGYLFEELKLFLVRENINNVFLLGNISNVYKYLYSSEIFLSTSFYEGHPISILEAMSIGLPIVATNVIGNCDTFINKYSGFYYELGDVNAACDYIRFILRDKKVYSSFAKESQINQRELFSLEIMKDKYVNLYKKFY